VGCLLEQFRLMHRSKFEKYAARPTRYDVAAERPEVDCLVKESLSGRIPELGSSSPHAIAVIIMIGTVRAAWPSLWAELSPLILASYFGQQIRREIGRLRRRCAEVVGADCANSLVKRSVAEDGRFDCLGIVSGVVFGQDSP